MTIDSEVSLKDELRHLKIVNKDLKNTITRLRTEALKHRASNEHEESAEVSRLKEAYELLEKETVLLRQAGPTVTPKEPEYKAEDSFVLDQLTFALEDEKKRNEILRRRVDLFQHSPPVQSLFDQGDTVIVEKSQTLPLADFTNFAKADIARHSVDATRLLKASRLLSGRYRDCLLQSALELDDSARIVREALYVSENLSLLLTLKVDYRIMNVVTRPDEWYTVVSNLVKDIRIAYTQGSAVDESFQLLRDLFAMKVRPRNSFIEEYGILAGLAMDIGCEEYQLRVFSLLPLTTPIDTRGERKAALKCAISDCTLMQMKKPSKPAQDVLGLLLDAFHQI